MVTGATAGGGIANEEDKEAPEEVETAGAEVDAFKLREGARGE